MHLVRYTTLALALAIVASAATGTLSNATSNTPTPGKAGSDASASALSVIASAERAMDPPSSGESPALTTSSKTASRADVPTWLQHMDKRTGNRRIDGVLLGPNSDFPALGNDRGISDCTVVAVHNIIVASTLRAHERVPRTTTSEAIAAWRELNGGASKGLTDLELLQAWSSPEGVLGSAITGWTSLDVTSPLNIKQAIATSGGVYVSINVPSTISWSTLVWTRPTSATTPVTDHAITLIGWVPQGWIAVSWGEVVLVPWADWRAEAVGAYLVRPNPVR